MAKNVKKVSKCFADSNKRTTFALAKRKGAIAQLVEQRTENPCVPGSIPGGTTLKEKQLSEKIAAFCYIFLVVFAGFVNPYVNWKNYGNNRQCARKPRIGDL